MIAFVFPGQGAQYPGMGKDLAANFKQAAAAFEEASDAISIDLKKLCFDGSDSDLKLTENTQPAILTVSIAALRALQAHTGKSPAMVAGHSLGEITALVAAGSIEFADAARLVRKRGKFMQEAVAPGVGAMAAILGMQRKSLEEALRDVPGVVEIANINSEEQMVIAGEAKAVEAGARAATGAGAKRAVMLEVSAPFHCSLMKPAAEKFAEALGGVKITGPKVPVVTNLEAKPNSDAGRIPELLTRQIFSPVLWLDSVNRMKADGITAYAEIGPGRVLSGLIRRIHREARLVNIEDSKGLSAAGSLVE